MEQKLFITNSRGLKLAAILHKPEGTPPFPAVIILHGFTGYKEEENLLSLATDLEKNGIVAFRFDASGFGESGGTLANDYLFSNYLVDAECVYRYIKSQDFVDKNRIGVVGHSWGGKMAVVFCARHHEIRSCVSISPAAALRKSNWLSAFMQAWEQKGYFKKISSKYGSIKIPFKVILDDEKLDPVKDVKNIKCPIFFILGLNDGTVSPKDTRAIYTAANEPKRILEIPGMNHDYKKHPEQIRLVNQKVIKFFRSTL